MALTKRQQWQRRSNRVRKAIGGGTVQKPRLVVYRSNTSFYAQIINDEDGKVLVESSSVKEKTGGNIVSAQKVGVEIAEKAKGVKVTEVIFDRNGYKYHGRVKALAEAAREAGLQF